MQKIKLETFFRLISNAWRLRDERVMSWKVPKKWDDICIQAYTGTLDDRVIYKLLHLLSTVQSGSKFDMSFEDALQLLHVTGFTRYLVSLLWIPRLSQGSSPPVDLPSIMLLKEVNINMFMRWKYIIQVKQQPLVTLPGLGFHANCSCE